jgi:hypothetical protein
MYKQVQCDCLSWNFIELTNSCFLFALPRKIKEELKTLLKCFAGIKSMRILLFGRRKQIHIHVIKTVLMIV